MSTTPDLPERPDVDRLGEDEDFDELGRRAGAALRRPAPADGVRDIAQRRRRQQALKTTVVGGAAMVSLIGALIVLADRDDTDRRRVGSSPATLSASTAPTSTGPETTTPAPAPTLQDEEIRVTADVVEFGGGLIGGEMARADGRTYVLAGRYQTEDDLFLTPTEAVVAAFDDTGEELWRTELEFGPSETTAGRKIVAVADDVWVWQNDELIRIDGSSGEVTGEVDGANVESIIGAFDSLWVLTRIVDTDGSEDVHPVRVIRVDPDLTSTPIELASDALSVPGEGGRLSLAAGAGAIWVPMDSGGLAAVDPDTFEVTSITRDEIGHDVHDVAVDGEVVYVASLDEVTSVVDGRVEATLTIDWDGGSSLGYLGHVDGAFGVSASRSPERFYVLRPAAPMIVEERFASLPLSFAEELDGESWARVETERSNDFDRRRVGLRPAGATTRPDVTGPPTATSGPTRWAGPVNDRGDAVRQIGAASGVVTWQDPPDADLVWVDVASVQFEPSSQSHWRIRLAEKPPPAPALERGLILAYGLVLDTNGDAVADYVVGLDNDVPRRGDYHVWVTDLATNETIEQTGPPYGYPVEFAHPDERTPADLTPEEAATVVFTFLDLARPTLADLDLATAQFYAWASATQNGEVVAWDYAPDTGWIT